MGNEMSEELFATDPLDRNPEYVFDGEIEAAIHWQKETGIRPYMCISGAGQFVFGVEREGIMFLSVLDAREAVTSVYVRAAAADLAGERSRRPVAPKSTRRKVVP